MNTLFSPPDEADSRGLVHPCPCRGHLTGAIIRSGVRVPGFEGPASDFCGLETSDDLWVLLGDGLPDGGFADEDQEDEEPSKHVEDPDDAEHYLRLESLISHVATTKQRLTQGTYNQGNAE